jgi:hypothetical protein
MRIQGLSSLSISVRAVEVEDTDGADGPAVLVTVKLASTDAGAEWDGDDFLAIRRQARTAAVDELSGQDVRLVYESDTPAEVDDDELDDVGGKRTADEDA